MKAQHEGTLTSPCIVWKNPHDPHWLLLPPARGHPTQGSPAPRSTFHPQHPGLPAQAARADPRGERHTRPGAASLAHSLLCDSAVRSVLVRWRDPGESDERTRNRVHALLAPQPGVRGCRGQRAGQVGPDAPGRTFAVKLLNSKAS